MKTLFRQNVILPGMLALLLCAPVMADDHKRNKKPVPVNQGSPTSRLVPGNQVKVSNSRAASLVKQRYSDSRILGVSLIDQGGSPMYRVRTLSRDGVVKSVFVDGRSGEVFE